MKVLYPMLCIWIGLILGLSFIATPAKFLAPSLTLSHALEVGNVTFGVFRWVEFGMLTLLALFCTQHSVTTSLRTLSAVLALIVVYQYLVLLPQLDLRVQALSTGVELDESSLHIVYVSLEASKIVLMLTMVIHMFKKIHPVDAQASW